MLLKKEATLNDNSYYEASVVRPPADAPLQGHITADVGVVGGGYAGLSAALELAARGYSVALLEARRIGWGASGRNGGQAIVGYAGQGAMERQLSSGDAHRAWDISVEALQLLQARIAAHAIDCDYTPGYLYLAVTPRKARALDAWVEHLARAYGYAMRWVGAADVRNWVASEQFHAGAFDPHSGHLHPLKYCLGLAAAARDAGVRIFEDSAVIDVRRAAQPLVRTAQGEIACRFVVLAGNVYLDQFGGVIAPELMRRIIPVGTYIIATEPMPKERADSLIRHRAAVSDTNFVLDYFRPSADHRLLFGGADAFSGATPPDLVEHVRQRMLAVFPQLGDLSVPYAWGGFVDVTINHAPDFGRIGSNIYYLQGFSGHGLALAGMAGKLVADALAGQAERFDLFTRIRHAPFPRGAWIRKPAVALGVLYYRLRDLL
ncbi:FAD-binding oxidoreductase [Noviherbaspirillum sp. UKPF54]|uniref:NAD(P)/FAD-dependent oxidoreductase n=1 Tax=Noviherbaspirillum sp. UKPF54 TaxID=2601898 RepID=UPI0011B0FE7F|nr:FAD-dependent oxidoreductase [Noviherbaspirillum sp. UKPF54]QDZ29967.1 FAD-binding oxidoreductase [Noviherbaspirillum sp. UKPF54]